MRVEKLAAKSDALGVSGVVFEEGGEGEGLDCCRVVRSVVGEGGYGDGKRWGYKPIVKWNFGRKGRSLRGGAVDKVDRVRLGCGVMFVYASRRFGVGSRGLL